MIDFQRAKSIVIPEGEVAKIARGEEVLWEKLSTRYTLADFAPGFVNQNTGAVEQNAAYPRAISSPLIPLESGKSYVLDSNLATNETDRGVRIRLYNASGSYVMSVTNSNFNNGYTSMTKSASSIYVSKEIVITAKQDCKIRIMFLDTNYVTSANFRDA